MNRLPHPWFHRVAWIAVILALCVIGFGAFVRLSHAGLSCPDWPTCYGKATWPMFSEHIEAANQEFPQRAVEVGKAWREQFHRHIASLLGLLVLTLAVMAARHRRGGLAVVLGSCGLVVVAIGLYMQQYFVASSVLAAVAEAVLLGFAWRWSNSDFARIATITLAVIIFQAMLGMWTVTWLLKPAVVMAHLIGGMTTFCLLTWIGCRASPLAGLPPAPDFNPKPMLWAGVGLVAVQIALGGWVSANYAALSCGTDFPTCLGQWWPEMDFSEAFVLWRGIGIDYEGGVLDGPARTAIQMSHRLFAIVVAAHLFFLARKLISNGWFGNFGWSIMLLLIVQVFLGISNVVAGLPLWVATAHNVTAALLLFAMVSLLARIRPAST